MSDRHRPDDIARSPVYPEITRAQWSVLVAMTDQRCEHMMEAMDFVSDLSTEAKDFLRSADASKVKRLNEHIEFYTVSKAVWKFIWIGGGVLLGLLQFWKTFGDYISVKLK